MKLFALGLQSASLPTILSSNFLLGLYEGVLKKLLPSPLQDMPNVFIVYLQYTISVSGREKTIRGIMKGPQHRERETRRLEWNMASRLGMARAVCERRDMRRDT